MKKLLAVLGVSAAILIGLLGYSVYELNNPEVPFGKMPESIVQVTPIVSPTEKTAETKTYAAPVAEKTVADNVVEEEQEQWDEENAGEFEELEEKLDTNIITHDDLSYAYTRLNEGERQVYDEIYRGIVSYMSKVPVSTTDPATLDKVFNCVMIDHPEIFYVNGYKYTKFTVGDVVRRVLFSASYTYSAQERDAIAADLNTVAHGILLNVYDGASDYDKIKFIFDTIVRQTEYDINSPDNQNIISVLLNKRSVCQGYSKTMQLLLNRLGIPCTLVNGTVKNGERHAWNIVKADGEWYYVDVTWGDASYILSEESDAAAVVPEINYDYMMVPYSELALTHNVETVIDMPPADSIADNYYVREGVYFTEYNEGQLRAAFDNAIATDQSIIILKCSDDNSYRILYDQLVNDQHIFDYVSGGDIAYSYNPEERKLLFALKR